MRSIFISGANQGLGYHAALQLAQKPNILLFLGSRKFEAAEEAIRKFSVDKSSEVIPVQLDVTDPTSVANAAKTVGENLQKLNKTGLDVLVNNAGTAQGDFQDIFAVNVFGVASLTAALRPLLTPTSASIINITSDMGGSEYWDLTKNPSPAILYAYGASKFAANGLTNIWAAEEAMKKSGVRVISICPGFNATNLNGYSGTMDPAEGSKIIVEAALEEHGKSQIFYNKDGPLLW